MQNLFRFWMVSWLAFSSSPSKAQPEEMPKPRTAIVQEMNRIFRESKVDIPNLNLNARLPSPKETLSWSQFWIAVENQNSVQTYEQALILLEIGIEPEKRSLFLQVFLPILRAWNHYELFWNLTQKWGVHHPEFYEVNTTQWILGELANQTPVINPETKPEVIRYLEQLAQKFPSHPLSLDALHILQTPSICEPSLPVGGYFDPFAKHPNHKLVILLDSYQKQGPSETFDRYLDWVITPLPQSYLYYDSQTVMWEKSFEIIEFFIKTKQFGKAEDLLRHMREISQKPNYQSHWTPKNKGLWFFYQGRIANIHNNPTQAKSHYLQSINLLHGHKEWENAVKRYILSIHFQQDYASESSEAIRYHAQTKGPLKHFLGWQAFWAKVMQGKRDEAQKIYINAKFPKKSIYELKSKYWLGSQLPQAQTASYLKTSRFSAWHLLARSKSLPSKIHFAMDQENEIQKVLTQLEIKKAHLESNPHSLQEKTYPLPYLGLVLRATKEYNVNPFLAYAIMRAESNYQPEVVSDVGALGLMQMMPQTGNKIALLLEDSGFSPYELASPPISILYGVKYLSYLLEIFEGNIPLVAAAYNAGPASVIRWMKQTPDIPLDQFLENIPFDQTRTYVNKVMVFLHSYFTIYQGSDKSYFNWVPSALSPLPKPKIPLDLF